MPDYQKLKLSDMFTEPFEDLPELECVAKVFNINKGHNKEFADRSVLLKDYEIFVSLVREYAKTMDRSTAIIKAIDDCISQNVLKDFLKTNSSEVHNMLFAKWDWSVAKEVWQEEAREEVLDLMKKGYGYEQIEKILKNREKKDINGGF